MRIARQVVLWASFAIAAFSLAARAQEGRGDVVYVPRQTWHLASFGGSEGMRSCRLAMNGFPYQAHMFEQD